MKTIDFKKLIVQNMNNYMNKCPTRNHQVCYTITQSRYSSREVGSDTDNVLSGSLSLEECIQRDVSENLFSDIS